MFVRVPTNEEARDVIYVDATAIEVDPDEISTHFASKNYSVIPPHLKRVKKITENNGDKFLLLVCLGTEQEVNDGITVKVPLYPPCTPEQFQLPERHGRAIIAILLKRRLTLPQQHTL